MTGNNQYRLPQKVEQYLSILSEIYGREGKKDLQEIVLNANIKIDEGTELDEGAELSDMRYGHSIILTMPNLSTVKSVKEILQIRDTIREDINSINSIQDEYIAAVYLEFDASSLREGNRTVRPIQSIAASIVNDEATQRIWGPSGYRVFLSHKSEAKRETATLKEQLRLFGMSCFVAHEDIHPTHAWQDEIERALSTMDAFVALMTPDFHDSHWTDQEVGFAFGRGVPIIAVRLGRDPYGFIGKFQALSATWEDASVKIARIFIRQERMFEAYVNALHDCPNYDSGNILARVFSSIHKLSSSQIDMLVSAYNNSSQLQGSFGFNGKKPREHGQGLAHYLEKLDPSRKFVYTNSGKLYEAI